MLTNAMKILAVAAVLSVSSSALAERKAPNRTPREVSGSININTATPAQLELLPGVGRKTAGLIVDHRAKKPFKTPAEIMDVKGIGDATWLKIKPYVTVSGPTTLALASAGKAARSEGKAEPAASPVSAGNGVGD